MTSSQVERPPGLRERKKARTRDAIQREALRLFSEQGYAETTVEQIAEAAEVSPSTFFRYFHTKEDSVLYDRIDPILIASFLEQPADMTPLQAIRTSIRDVFAQLPTDESELETMRHRLVFTEPDLRSRVLERLVDTMALLADAVAKRVRLDPADQRVQVFTGCVVGTIVAEVYGATGADVLEVPPAMSGEMMKHIDDALAMLQVGVPFEDGTER